MKMIETMAKTLEEAIEIALKELDAEREEVEINVLSRGKSGILGIGGEPAKVRVTVLGQPDEVVKVTTRVLQDLVSKMSVSAVVTLEKELDKDVGGPVFDIDGDDSGLLIGRRGETLRALQLLVSFIASRQLQERASIFLDIGGYQKRRYEVLTNLSQRVAQRVASTGRSISLEPMPPNERRVIHMSLADYSGVHTVSTGSGDQRQVVVRPIEE